MYVWKPPIIENINKNYYYCIKLPQYENNDLKKIKHTVEKQNTAPIRHMKKAKILWVLDKPNKLSSPVENHPLYFLNRYSKYHITSTDNKPILTLWQLSISKFISKRLCIDRISFRQQRNSTEDYHWNLTHSTHLIDEEILLLKSPKELNEADPRPLVKPPVFFFCSDTNASRLDIKSKHSLAQLSNIINSNVN